MHILLSKQARKALLATQPKRAATIREAIALLAEDPQRAELDIKKLVGRDGYRLRVGDWRVIYVLMPDTRDVLWIGPRGDAYR